MPEWEAARTRHPLAVVARRTGLDVPDQGEVTVDCPFHVSHGHHSLYLHLGHDDGRDTYYCFAEGCPAHKVNPATGRARQLDVIQWVRDAEGVGIGQAIWILDRGGPITTPGRPDLAGRQGSAIEAWDRAEQPCLDRTPAERVLAANYEAWRYYTYGNLHDAGVDYLGGRGIDVRSLEAATGPLVGHTPLRAPDQLVERLRTRGFSDDELVDAGLARRRSGRPLVDFYRRRVMLPVRDSHGRVSGLIGRYDGPGDGAGIPKYLNPPRTVTFDKSTFVYRPTRTAPDADGQIVVCEGTLDALAVAIHAHRCGLSKKYAPVSTSGVAISERQWAAILAINSRPPVLCADGDTAGCDANLRWATRIAVHFGRESCVTRWPEGEDPTSWLAKRGPEGLTAVTRRGCLEPHPGELCPEPAGAAVTRHLAEQGNYTEALRLADRMVTCAARLRTPGRYPALAGEALVAALDDIDTDGCPDRRGRFDGIIRGVAARGAGLDGPARTTFAHGAGRALSAKGYGPNDWLVRKVTAAAATAFAHDGTAASRCHIIGEEPITAPQTPEPLHDAGGGTR